MISILGLAIIASPVCAMKNVLQRTSSALWQPVISQAPNQPKRALSTPASFQRIVDLRNKLDVLDNNIRFANSDRRAAVASGLAPIVVPAAVVGAISRPHYDLNEAAQITASLVAAGAGGMFGAEKIQEAKDNFISTTQRIRELVERRNAIAKDLSNHLARLGVHPVIKTMYISPYPSLNRKIKFIAHPS